MAVAPTLTTAERDLICFLAQYRQRDPEHIERLYLQTRERFDFRSAEYRKLWAETIPQLYALLYDNSDDRAVVGGYRHLALLHMLRKVGYETVQETAGRDLADEVIPTPAAFAGWSELYRNGPAGLRLLDYGCGIADRSLAVARRYRTRTILVDIDALTFRFACFRFEKAHLPYEPVPITEENLYPELPPCDFVIMFNVLEHLRDPIRALRNVRAALPVGGCVMINNITAERCLDEWQHISPDMGGARAWIREHFTTVTPTVFRKDHA